jgi:hypothetical protein
MMFFIQWLNRPVDGIPEQYWAAEMTQIVENGGRRGAFPPYALFITPRIPSKTQVPFVNAVTKQPPEEAALVSPAEFAVIPA